MRDDLHNEAEWAFSRQRRFSQPHGTLNLLFAPPMCADVSPLTDAEFGRNQVDLGPSLRSLAPLETVVAVDATDDLLNLVELRRLLRVRFQVLYPIVPAWVYFARVVDRYRSA